MEYWQYSELYNIVDSIAKWTGPLPSQFHLCTPREDLIYIVSYQNTKSKLEKAVNLLIPKTGK